MRVNLPFFDTSYLVRLYLDDRGYEAVREFAGKGMAVATAWHARAEVVAALHRSFRERRMKQREFRAVLEQFKNDSERDLFEWIPLTDSVRRRLEAVFFKASATVFLRGADALHLACAVENGFTEVFSNDRHFLAAAPLFGLKPINLIE